MTKIVSFVVISAFLLTAAGSAFAAPRPKSKAVLNAYARSGVVKPTMVLLPSDGWGAPDPAPIDPAKGVIE